MTPAELFEGYATGARDFRSADLSDADLSDADLSDADLSDADLRRADLRRADLRRADLRRADLRRADLSDADLSRADLYGANLFGADLSDADLFGVLNPPTSSHAFIGEILRQSAHENVERRKIAGLVIISHDWCWDAFEQYIAERASPEILVWIVETLGVWPHMREKLERYGFTQKAPTGA